MFGMRTLLSLSCEQRAPSRSWKRHLSVIMGVYACYGVIPILIVSSPPHVHHMEEDEVDCIRRGYSIISYIRTYGTR